MDMVKIRNDATSLCIGTHLQHNKANLKSQKKCLGYSVKSCKNSISFIWKNKSSLLFDIDGKSIKSRQVVPETVRGINDCRYNQSMKKSKPRLLSEFMD